MIWVIYYDFLDLILVVEGHVYALFIIAIPSYICTSNGMC